MGINELYFMDLGNNVTLRWMLIILRTFKANVGKLLFGMI